MESGQVRLLNGGKDNLTKLICPPRVRRTSSKDSEELGDLNDLIKKNRAWSEDRKAADPLYFDRLCNQQAPKYLWIGCADSRVPANVIMGLESGEVFVQRNVGNIAMHTDLNCMSCLEYAVKELKVKTVIVCGHYQCGAVKAALNLASKTPGLVNCWISDIRECRNVHQQELRRLDQAKQMDRLCELNVLRQTFHVCTSPVVQSAWDAGQDLSVYGVIYGLNNGLITKLVGPLRQQDEYVHNINDFETINLEDLHADSPRVLSPLQSPERHKCMASGSVGGIEHILNTANMASQVAQHVSWSNRN